MHVTEEQSYHLIWKDIEIIKKQIIRKNSAMQKLTEKFMFRCN